MTDHGGRQPDISAAELSKLHEVVAAVAQAPERTTHYEPVEPVEGGPCRHCGRGILSHYYAEGERCQPVSIAQLQEYAKRVSSAKVLHLIESLESCRHGRP